MASTIERTIRLRGRGHRYDTKERLRGIYLGIVEYNIDPMKQGRCKVRIPPIHSTEKSIETKDLPWSNPCGNIGGLHDFGSHQVPPVGSMVYIQFLMGEPDRPLYFGGIYRNLTDRPLWKDRFHKRIEANIKVSRETGDILPNRSISMGKWLLPLGPEVPLEILHTPYEPTTHLIFKTQKGASIFARDMDGFEQLRVIDRSGQELTFTSPISEEANAHNEARRGNASALEGTPHSSELWDDNQGGILRSSPTDYTNIIGRTSSIELVGVTGQGVRIVSRKNSEAITIESSDGGTDRTSLVLGGGLGASELVGEYDGEEVFSIKANARTGIIEISGKAQVVISTGSVSIDAKDVRISGNLSVDGDLSVGGGATVSGRMAGGEG